MAHSNPLLTPPRDPNLRGEEPGYRTMRVISYYSTDEEEPESTTPAWLERVKVLVAITMVVSAVYVAIVAVQENWLDQFSAWAQHHKLHASIALGLAFIPVALAFLPLDVPLYLIAGFMYGPVFGSLVCWAGYNVGSWVAFFVGRYLFRDWFIKYTRKSLYMRAIHAAVKDNALVLVLLLQIAPIMPYSILCYFFGTSGCRFGTYAFGTAVGIIPCIAFFVFVGSTMATLAQAAEGDADKGGSYWVFFWVTGMAGVATLAFITVAAKQKLDQIVSERSARHERRAAARQAATKAQAGASANKGGSVGSGGGGGGGSESTPLVGSRSLLP